ncbi:MAG: PAS domain S-box protein [Gemmatimonadetes bacterium]|nr:PAS domain S-box protein [Gemmatimonadota bacterium]
MDTSSIALKRRMNERLEQLRWTLAELAEKTSENYRNVHRWLREDVKVPADFVARFVEVVPVSADWLLTGEGTLEPIPPSSAEMALEQIAQIVDRLRPGTSGRGFLESVINSSLDGILAFDPEYRYTVWNTAMERISGMSAFGVLGRPAFELFPFLREIGEDKYFEAVLRGEAVIARDRPFWVAESKREGWYEAYYSPLRNGTGDIVGGLGVVRDITERKVSEQNLRDSEERYRRLVEQSPDGVLVHVEGRIAYANPAAARILHASGPEAVMGRWILDIVHPEDRPASERRIRRVLEDRVPVGPLLLRVVRLDGREITIELAAARVSYMGKAASQVVFRRVRAKRGVRRGSAPRRRERAD